jgi:LmbE family N-acetylglucosaminyl deacetylase
MQFHMSTAEFFAPDALAEEKALARATHLAFAAHHDDLEIMAAGPILECFQQTDKRFAGVIVTDGRGSPRDGLYKSFTDEEMRRVRFKEQRKAAVVGEYAALAMLDYPSKAIKDGRDRRPAEDMAQLLRAARPRAVFTHNLADKHDTHVGVALKVIEAVRSLPAELRPERLYGCEVWRDLDWMIDADKVAFDVSKHENLQAALLGIFDSQIAGGKRYDLATMGRRKANATYFASHGVDTATGMNFAMDLTPLARDASLDPAAFAQGFITRFAEEVAERMRKLKG